MSNLVAVGRDSMTLYVSWDKPVALNGVLKNYIIFVNQMDSGENISVKEVDVNTQNITIHQFGKYQILGDVYAHARNAIIIQVLVFLTM